MSRYCRVISDAVQVSAAPAGCSELDTPKRFYLKGGERPASPPVTPSSAPLRGAGPSSLVPLVAQVRRQPALRFFDREALPGRVVSHLVPAHLSNREVLRVRVCEVQA